MFYSLLMCGPAEAKDWSQPESSKALMTSANPEGLTQRLHSLQKWHWKLGIQYSKYELVGCISDSNHNLLSLAHKGSRLSITRCSISSNLRVPITLTTSTHPNIQSSKSLLSLKTPRCGRPLGLWLRWPLCALCIFCLMVLISLSVKAILSTAALSTIFSHSPFKLYIFSPVSNGVQFPPETLWVLSLWSTILQAFWDSSLTAESPIKWRLVYPRTSVVFSSNLFQIPPENPFPGFKHLLVTLDLAITSLF